MTDGSRYAYRLTDKGTRVTLMFIIFHQRVCGPLANGLFHRKPTQPHTPASKLQAAYEKADARSNKSSIYLPLEILRDKFSDLRFKNLECRVHGEKRAQKPPKPLLRAIAANLKFQR